MCGIIGMCALRTGRPLQPGRAAAGLALLRHRGPDDEGLVALDEAGEAVTLGGPDTPTGAFALPFPYRADRSSPAFEAHAAAAVLGSRRLAIQDLSPAGHQPMCTPDGVLWIAFNGEIFNFGDLRSELEAKGHVFRSHSDTEVVLHAYEEWGDDCFARFNGMWAVALWDTRAHRLVLCRDRFGVKPLVYASTNDALLFASEPKALFATGLIAPAAHDELVAQYLAYGLVDHTAETLFAGVRALPPGHLLILEAGKASVRRWYELPIGFRDVTPGEFADLLEDAVSLRLVSDVPVGTCLSGGLDSSSITALVDRLMRRSGAKLGPLEIQKVFSARHPGTPHDEGPFIDAVVEATGAQPHVVVPTAEGLAGQLEDLVWHQDEPFASTSIYAQWEVYGLARSSGVVVTLDGQGGDETVAGYSHHRTALLLQHMRSGRLVAWLREAGAGATPEQVARLAAASAASAVRTYLPRPVRAPLLARRTGRFVPDWVAWAHPVHPSELLDHGRRLRDTFASQLFGDLTIGLPSLLRYADRNSMAHSVEARMPFLDYRVVELALALPASSRVHHGETKRILRQAMHDLVPPLVLARRDKIAFSTPEAEWLRGPLAGTVDEIVASSSFRARPWFHHDRVASMLARFRAGDPTATAEVWRCVNIELWLRLCVDGATARGPKSATIHTSSRP